MLIDGSKLTNFPILSLHMGMPIAHITEPIIDPHKLQIVAFHLTGPEVGGENGTILDARDIREFSNLGMIIDSSDSFINPGDVIRLDDIIKLNFSLVGLKVETKKGSKLGRVTGYTFEPSTLSIHQLIIKRPALKALTDPELVIPRSEIVSIDDYKVIVKDEEKEIKQKAVKEDFVPNFVNPFREPDFAPSPIDREE